LKQNWTSNIPSWCTKTSWISLVCRLLATWYRGAEK